MNPTPVAIAPKPVEISKSPAEVFEKVSKPKDKIEYTILVSDELRRYSGVTKLTFNNWLKNYNVGGDPIGIRVGGRWRVSKALLDRFLNGEGTKNK